MDNIERLLKESKDELDKLEIPEEIESRLRNTLDNVPNKKRVNIRSKIAVLIITILLISYGGDTLAYYGMKLMGYGNIMNGTLQELNELGKGQIIDESYEFKNGATVTLDGIMLDDNNLIVFHTTKDPSGNAQNIDSDLSIRTIEGLFGNIYHGGGHGKANEDGTEVKWILTYDAPRFYEKNLRFKMESLKTGEVGVIDFTLDRNQAMGHSLKIAIDKKIDIDGRSMQIKSLVASPTSTIIKGQIQNIAELGMDHIKGERFMPENIELALLADGKEIEVQGSSISTDMKGVTFNIRYDALPLDTKDIQIKLMAFGGNHDVDEVIQLKKGKINKNVKIHGQDIIINEVYEGEGNTYINLTTDENLALSKVLLNIDGERIRPEETISGDYEEIVDGENTRIDYTRTIKFKGIGKKLELEIEGIRYNKQYKKIIYSYK